MYCVPNLHSAQTNLSLQRVSGGLILTFDHFKTSPYFTRYYLHLFGNLAEVVSVPVRNVIKPSESLFC